MKNNTKFTLALGAIALGVLLGFNACDKDISQDAEELRSYVPATLDENGGSWKLYLPDTLNPTVATPTDPTSQAYLDELAEVKSLANGRSTEEESRANWWNAGAVYRWNQVARDLAARYNVPPPPKPDGTYGVPSAADPFAEPKFPFANPPYASRAFAYVAVAQYEALVACWKAKYQYNRKAPSKYDGTIETARGVSDLPSYPSEDAVVAAASYELLAVLFPCEKEYLAQLREEHIESRLWAGTNVRSDLDAGRALGVAFAQKVLGRAKTDGMGASNNQTIVPDLITAAKSRDANLVPWESLEDPKRPPMLPNFGKVKPWNLASADLATVRPPQPPSIGSAEFEKDLDELREIAKKPTREQQRIANFWSDGVGSYTPPGHWNREACNLVYAAKMNELRAARTVALVSTAVEDAGISCWETKYYYYTPRPFQMDNDVKSTIGTPNFPSYTSGHSTFSAAGATVLSHLFPAESSRLNALASEASESRVFGCIHYRADCTEGLKAGQRVAAFAVARAQVDGAE